MRRKDLKRLVYFVIFIYTCAILIGVYVTSNFTEEDFYHRLYFNLIPFILAIPAAYLSWGFQRRMSYIRALREIWTDIIKACGQAIEYTFLDKPDEGEYKTIVMLLENSIEYLRMLFKNIKVTFFKFECKKCKLDIYSKRTFNEIKCEKCGEIYNLNAIKQKEKLKIAIYPIDSIKRLYEEFNKIRDSMFFEEKEITRKELVRLYKRIRTSILEEFDRVVPTKVESVPLTEKNIAFIKK